MAKQGSHDNNDARFRDIEKRLTEIERKLTAPNWFQEACQSSVTYVKGHKMATGVLALTAAGVVVGISAFWYSVHKDRAKEESDRKQQEFSANVRKVVEPELAPINSQLSDLSKRMDKVEAQLELLVAIQKNSKLSTTVPNPGHAPTADTRQLVASLDKTISLVKLRLTDKTPGDPDELAKTKEGLQNIVKRQKPLPQEVKTVAFTALLYVQFYEIFTARPNSFPLWNVTVDTDHRTGSAICVPEHPPLINQTACMFYLGEANRPEEVGVYRVMVQNCSPAPGSNPAVPCEQDITGIWWVDSGFNDSWLVYQGGPLHLINATFDKCKLIFGDDTRSKSVREYIENAAGKPVTINLPGQYPPSK